MYSVLSEFEEEEEKERKHKEVGRIGGSYIDLWWTIVFKSK